MKIKGAIFDMDGTLINSLTFWKEYWKNVGKKFFDTEDFIPDPSVDAAVRTMIFVKAQKLIKDFYDLNVSDEEMRAFSDAGVLDFYKSHVTVKDGAFAFLEHLKKSGIQMCIASATEKNVILFALSHLGLAQYFDEVLSCADIGKNKDVPDIYLMARDTLGFAEAELCVFEDSYVAIETAKRAGFLTVGIYDENNFSQDRLKAASDIYLGEGHSMEELIGQIEA